MQRGKGKTRITLSLRLSAILTPSQEAERQRGLGRKQNGTQELGREREVRHNPRPFQQNDILTPL